MAAAPPFVSYSSMSEAVVPPADWPCSTRRSRRSRRTCRSTRAASASTSSSRVEDDGSVRVHCYTTWDTPEQLEVFLERGYTFERLLADVGLARARSEAS